MKILITNDDGIHAAGIEALWKACSKLGEVFVVAPATEKSACSHSITIRDPIQVEPVFWQKSHVKAWKVKGTPADCVKLALEALLDFPPDLVVSGINHGANVGTDIFYSGTVSAAVEAALNHIPAIAVSINNRNIHHFSPALTFLESFIPRIIKKGLPAQTLLNVNLPDCQEDELRPLKITRLGVRGYENTFEQRLDPYGQTYYWMGGSICDKGNDIDTDVEALRQGHISLTPILLDLTHHTFRKDLQTWV